MTQTTTPPVPQATIVMSADDLHNPAVLRRFWKYVHKTDTCWLWTGSKTGEGGYGRFFVNRRMCLAHRFAYELLVGPIPVGLELDHVRARGCTNRHCVRVDHLEPVTRRENLLRGNGAPARNARLTHCKNGHPVTPETSYVHGGARHCVVCRRQAWMRAYWRRRGTEAA
jgi:hypothetical protein